MVELSLAALAIPAFIAGLLTFLAPCTLPLVPAYLAFISGTSLESLKDPTKARGVRLKIFLNGLFFVLGFSAVFIILGTLVAFVSSIALAPYRIWLARIGGVFVIAFGLFMLNILKIPALMQEKQFKTPAVFKQGNPLNSLLLGSAFAFGWTPCVGPILGSILLLASTTTTTFQGAALLAIFSAGLAIPFLIIALAIGWAANYLNRISGLLKVVSYIGGVFLILLGILLLTDNMTLLITYGYKIFQFIDYERILDYL